MAKQTLYEYEEILYCPDCGEDIEFKNGKGIKFEDHIPDIFVENDIDKCDKHNKKLKFKHYIKRTTTIQEVIYNGPD